MNRREFLAGAACALLPPTTVGARKMVLTKIGYAQPFAEWQQWEGPCEADFININNRLKVIHHMAGPTGHGDAAITNADAAGPSQLLIHRDRDTMLRYPYTFKAVDGYDYLTGVRDDNHSHSWLYKRFGNGDETWYQQNGDPGNPILYESGAYGQPWSEIYNNAMLDIPDGLGGRIWMCAPEIGGGIGLALGTTFANIEAGKSTGVVIPDAGNAYLDNYQDEWCMMWAGMHGFPGYAHEYWYTTIFAAKFSDLRRDRSNQNNWTNLKDYWAIAEPNINICDPSVFRMGNRSLLMVSYDQKGMHFFEGPNLDRMYRLMLASAGLA